MHMGGGLKEAHQHLGVSIHWSTGLDYWTGIFFGFYIFHGHIFGFTHSKFLSSLKVKGLDKTFSLLLE